ncbi:hypothetical protein ABQE62_13545 [Mycolicibacterium fortuitum]
MAPAHAGLERNPARHRARGGCGIDVADAIMFDGVPTATDGHLHVDSSVSGHGMAVSGRASDYRLG